jgi:hypothetical protein
MGKDVVTNGSSYLSWWEGAASEPIARSPASKGWVCLGRNERERLEHTLSFCPAWANLLLWFGTKRTLIQGSSFKSADPSCNRYMSWGMKNTIFSNQECLLRLALLTSSPVSNQRGLAITGHHRALLSRNMLDAKMKGMCNVCRIPIAWVDATIFCWSWRWCTWHWNGFSGFLGLLHAN